MNLIFSPARSTDDVIVKEEIAAVEEAPKDIESVEASEVEDKDSKAEVKRSYCFIH